jgi:predicted nucleic acid-binding protein
MRDFLIDTNIWEYWFNPAREPEHSHVLKRISELKKRCERTEFSFRIWISCVTWGELEYGYQVQTKKERSLETPFRRFIHGIAPKEFFIDRHVAHDYGRIRARLFNKYGPSEKKKKGRRPEQLIDPATSLELQIQENDLWLVAQAITRDFVFVTNDRKSLQPLLEVAGDELNVENWAAENT